MSTRLLIASVLLYLVTLTVVGFGALYSFRQTIMPYHEEFLGVRFEQLDPKVRRLMLALMRVSGVTFFALAAGLAILISGPFRQGAAWAGWVIYTMLLVALIPLLVLTRQIGRKTPWPVVLLLIVLVIAALYRPLAVGAFDPAFLRAVGTRAPYGAMFLALVVLALVANFQAFGTLLAVGPILLPAAAARCWGLGMAASMALATGFGLAASVAGLLVSYHGNLPSGPVIVLAAGLLFGISFVVTSSLRRLAPLIGWEA